MAAIDSKPTQVQPWSGSIVQAACALPGVMSGLVAGALCAGLPLAAQAEEAPEQGVVAIKYSHYQEAQPSRSSSATGIGGGLNPGGQEDSESARRRSQSASTYNDVSRASGGGGGGSGQSSVDQRMHVNSPSIYLMLPLGRAWSVEGSATLDEVSGASPRYYTDMSGASKMTDRRTAGDVKVTRYFERQTLGLGVSHSAEHDYVSNALSLDGSWASEDHNTTWNAGLGLTKDSINPSNDIVTNEHKTTRELQLGVTQALSSRDLAQASFTLSRGEGYFNDPYKLYDNRPRQRHAEIALLRWNHWLGESALKTSYRFYHDNYGVQAHTVELAWVKPFTASTTFTPLVRYATQRAASFYVDPSSDSSIYPGPAGSPTYFSSDQRLSAFGTLALGLKQETKIDGNWTVDLKLEGFAQDAKLRLGGAGSPGLDRLYGLLWQIGLSRKF